MAVRTGSTFYRRVADGARIWVTGDGRVRVYGATHTSNPHQPGHKWFQVARVVGPRAYAAKKVAEGAWRPEDDCLAHDVTANDEDRS